MNLLGLQKAAHTIFSVPHLQVCLVGLKELMTNTCRTGFVMKQWSFCCHQRKKTPRFPDVRFEGGFPSIGKACTFVLMRVECWKLLDKSGPTSRGGEVAKVQDFMEKSKEINHPEHHWWQSCGIKFRTSQAPPQNHDRTLWILIFQDSMDFMAWCKFKATNRVAKYWTYIHAHVYIYIYTYIRVWKNYFFLFDCLFPPATPGELTTAGRSGQHPQLLHSGVPNPYVSPCVHFRDMSGFRTRSNEQDKTRIGVIAAAVAVGVGVVVVVVA